MKRFLNLLIFALMPSLVFAADGGNGEAENLLLALALILIAAKIGNEISFRLKIPAVVGELGAGIILGNLTMIGWDLHFLLKLPSVEILAKVGVVLLLFEVGLETTVKQMLAVGGRAFAVAVVGVIVPVVLGFGFGKWFFPDAHWSRDLFLGATMCATSIGITARVFQEMGISQTLSARVVLGAAVIDDILGLMVLAIVVGIIASLNAGVTLDMVSILGNVGLSVGFVVGALILGTFFSRRAFKTASRLRTQNVLLPLSLAFCFLLAFLATKFGLASIVGAYAAGLILDEVHFKFFESQKTEKLEEMIHPLVVIFAPVFFVTMGANVDLSLFAQSSMWLFGIGLIVIAFVSKLVCGLMVPGKVYNRWVVGLGMAPRGEVGLIFLGIGSELSIAGEKVIDKAAYGSVLLMILATTVLAPIFLKKLTPASS